MPTLEELQGSFKAFDADGSGSLSADELITILMRPGGGTPLTLEEAKALIATVDTNNDGVLQMEEFCELMTTPGSLTMLPAPAATHEARLKDYEGETAVLKKNSPLRAYFTKIAARDESIKKVQLITWSTTATL